VKTYPLPHLLFVIITHKHTQEPTEFVQGLLEIVPIPNIKARRFYKTHLKLAKKQGTKKTAQMAVKVFLMYRGFTSRFKIAIEFHPVNGRI